MEQLILYGVGLAAVGYVGKLAWNASHGKTECNCGKCNPACAKVHQYPVKQNR
ncbi:hypothetical protein [Acetonema longum]|nr:hypothetical protein [Acetonema longum]